MICLERGVRRSRRGQIPGFLFKLAPLAPPQVVWHPGSRSKGHHPQANLFRENPLGLTLASFLPPPPNTHSVPCTHSSFQCPPSSPFPGSLG